MDNGKKLKNRAIELNTNTQFYKGIPIRLIERKSYSGQSAKRYVLNNTNQNIWIPNVFLLSDGTIKENADIDFIFKKAFWQKKLEYANIDINPLRWAREESFT